MKIAYPIHIRRIAGICFFYIATLIPCRAQDFTERTVADYIGSPQLYPSGNQTGFPALRLGGPDLLELHFDDLDGGVRNYYYTFELRNADWSPVMLNALDYIKGYSQSRINTYRNSSVSLTTYTHYQVELPERNMQPTRSGNYLLKVFLDGDTSKLVFTKRFIVVQPAVTIAAQVRQPFGASAFRTSQKIQFNVNLGSANIPIPNQQVKAYVLQNYRWDNASRNVPPTFVRQNMLEFNSEQQCVFPAGKEWRWLDLRSFRLQSDRVQKADYLPAATNIYLRPDPERRAIPSVNYKDLNGRYYIETLESLNPFWQADYATVYFKYVPKTVDQYNGKEVVLTGEFTGYGQTPAATMKWNEEGYYETSLFLKQGYYDYIYLLKDPSRPDLPGDNALTEGNDSNAENVYTILIYYRPFGARADELIGMESVNSFGM